MTHIVASLKLLPCYSELKYYTQRSCSDLFPNCYELKHNTDRSSSEILPNYPELKHDTHLTALNY